MQRVLVVSVNWLGDAIMLTPAFKAIKQSIPTAYVAVMAHKRVADVFSENPYVDEVILFDERGSEKTLFAKLAFVRNLRRKKFDTAFFVQRSFTRVLICALSGIRERIGYARFKNAFVLTKRITARKGFIHRQDHYLYLFEAVGLMVEDRMPQVYISQDVRIRARHSFEAMGNSHRRIVGINPSANWILKRWPSEYFAKVCDRLAGELNCAIVCFGTEKDRGVVNAVITHMKEKVYDYCGKTTIKELAALMEELDLFISNDSGPAHLAAAMGTPTLVIFGPTSPEITAPRGRRVTILANHAQCKIPCYNDVCADLRCMKEISVDKIFLEAKSILQDN